MRGPLRHAYDAVATLARVASAAAPESNTKWLRALAARRGVVERYKAWAEASRDAARPLLWMHAPSVGEGLQARPVLERFRERRADVQLAYTYFSPSAAAFAATLDVDVRDYLVFDARDDVAAALDALRPTALVFSKLDVWPNLVEAAASRRVRLGLISATLAAASTRRSGLARTLLHDAYAALDAVGAIDAADADRLVELGVRRSVIAVTGDVRYDQVWARAAAVDRESGDLATLVSDRATLVAGSTWPADDDVILPGFLEIRRAVPNARLIIAPHEPTAAHLHPVIDWAQRYGLRLVRYGEPVGAADVVLVDRVGVLGDVYAAATVAYVGGGFHAAGLHSVIEPAAFGAPVLFGPRHGDSRDASLLIARGGGAAVTSANTFSTTARGWLSDRARRADAGARARSVVESGLGAADRSFELVTRLLSP